MRRATVDKIPYQRQIDQFLSTLSLRRATRTLRQLQSALCHFYPRSPCGERRPLFFSCWLLAYFYPRSPCGERLCLYRLSLITLPISIHALLAESDLEQSASYNAYLISIHALLAESDITDGSICLDSRISIHALLAESDCYSLRHSAQGWYFYPRSPCGERPSYSVHEVFANFISIHALLAESDARNTSMAGRITLFLSTLSLRRATPVREIIQWEGIFLSTLSLRRATPATSRNNKHNIFLSTLSLRRATTGLGVGLYLVTISIHALLAESDFEKFEGVIATKISIHALLAESDAVTTLEGGSLRDFYPRSPCGERHNTPLKAYNIIKDFYPRSPCGERPPQGCYNVTLYPISIHALLAESDGQNIS